MGWLEFVAALVKELAWPVTVAIALIILRVPILSLFKSISKISHGDMSLEFERKAKEVGASIVADAVLPSSAQLAGVESIASQNVAKIVGAWSELENIVRAKLVSDRVEGAEALSGISVVNAARKHNLISADQENSLKGLHTMRNLSVHSPDGEITDYRVNEFLVLSEAMKTVLEMTSNIRKEVNRNIASGIYGQGELATMNVSDLKKRLETDA